MKVLYILGSARCGSTIISNVLGEAPGTFSAGEIRLAWDRMLRGRMCGCGDPIATCDVWSRALATAADGQPTPAPEDVVGWQRQAVKLRHTWSVIRAAKGGRPSDPLRRYVNAMGSVIDRLEESQEVDLIVDASLRPSNGAALGLIDGVEPYYLHLIRDPRGVVASMTRPKEGPDGGLGVKTLRQSIAHWTATNVASDAVRRAFPERSLAVRYEDLMREPVSWLRRLHAFVGIAAEPAVSAEGEVRLHANHNVAGNPNRFQSGVVTLRPDEGWKSVLSDRESRIVVAACAPVAMRYRNLAPTPGAAGSQASVP